MIHGLFKSKFYNEYKDTTQRIGVTQTEMNNQTGFVWISHRCLLQILADHSLTFLHFPLEDINIIL